MAKENLILVVLLITALLIASVAILGAGCGQQEQQQEQEQEQEQQQQQQQQQTSTLFSDDFNMEQTGGIPSKWQVVFKEGVFASVKGTTQSNDAFGMVLELKGRFVRTGESNWKDYTVDTEFKISNAGEHEGPEVMFRMQDENNYYLFTTETQPTGTNYALYKVTDGTKWEFKQRASAKRIDDTAWHDLKVSIQGNDFTAYMDDENVLTTTVDGTFNTGDIGLMSHPFSSIYFDNLAVIGTTA